MADFNPPTMETVLPPGRYGRRDRGGSVVLSWCYGQGMTPERPDTTLIFGPGLALDPASLAGLADVPEAVILEWVATARTLLRLRLEPLLGPHRPRHWKRGSRHEVP